MFFLIAPSEYRRSPFLHQSEGYPPLPLPQQGGSNSDAAELFRLRRDQPWLFASSTPSTPRPYGPPAPFPNASTPQALVPRVSRSTPGYASSESTSGAYNTAFATHTYFSSRQTVPSIVFPVLRPVRRNSDAVPLPLLRSSSTHSTSSDCRPRRAITSSYSSSVVLSPSAPEEHYPARGHTNSHSPR